MNPYRLLNLGRDAGPHDIMQAAALALREKRHSAREIAEARRRLMDPSHRSLLDFICFADLEPLLRPSGGAEGPLRPDSLKRLEIFDAT